MFLNYDVFLSLKVVLILANSKDPDEMQHTAAFHLVFTVCQKCKSRLNAASCCISSGSSLFANNQFRGFQYAKG